MLLMEALDHQKKKFNINFNKPKTKFYLCLHYNINNSYLLVHGKEIFKVKVDSKNYTFQLSFVLEVYLMDLVILSL